MSVFCNRTKKGIIKLQSYMWFPLCRHKISRIRITGIKLNDKLDQFLAPGSYLCNTLRTKLHAWTKSSIIVEFMVTFIWQHNLPVGSYHTFKMPLEDYIFVAQRAKMRSPCNSKTISQRSEPKWLLKYIITPYFCAKFQPNRLATTFGRWNTFSGNDT